MISVDFSVTTVRVNTHDILPNKNNLMIALSGPMMNLIFSVFVVSKIEIFHFVYF